MISSRWPRPIGTSESIAFNPVCTGSCTDLRGMMPGAFTSTRPRTTSVSGPLPSIGVPSPSTTRPSSPLPTGTSTIEPVPGNSTISPAMQFCRPKTRAIPSPTDSTWPVSATLASVSNAAICCFRISEISAGRISISGGSLHGVLQALQAGFQRGVVQAGPDAHNQPAEQVRLHGLIDVDVAVAGLDQAGLQLVALDIVQLVGGGNVGGDNAALFGHQGGEGGNDPAQGTQPAVGDDHANQVADRFAEA